MGFRVQIWSGGALWNPLSFLIKDSIQSNLWTGKESSLLKIQLVKNKMRQIQRCDTGHYPVMNDYKNEWFIAVDCSFLGYVSKLEIKYKTEKPAP